MRKLMYPVLSVLLALGFNSCKEETDLSPQLAGLWIQNKVIVDDEELPLSDAEKNTSLLLEKNGVYRLFDGTASQLHNGTWLFSDGDWLNLSMDKIQGTLSTGGYKFGQVLVRFTILHVDNNSLELRIKTYLFERKETVMFNLMTQDNTAGMTGEELLALDTANKQLHTYRYVFSKVEL